MRKFFCCGRSETSDNVSSPRHGQVTEAASGLSTVHTGESSGTVSSPRHGQVTEAASGLSTVHTGESNGNVRSSRYGQVTEAASGLSTVHTGNGNMARREWVIALDFGTTYSGFAYSQRLTGNLAPIHLYYDYPKSRQERVYCKTPSSLYYSREESGNLKCSSWGYIARSTYMRNSDEIRQRDAYLTKFKLLLMRDLIAPVLAASIPPPLTSMSIITDYMRLIGEQALSQVRNHHARVEKFGPHLVQWVVTVPSIWDESAKQQMKTCMMNTGLVSDMDALSVVLEPEAASFHCHEILRKQEGVSLNRADKILVADVGGGTVDIVVQEMVGNSETYQVQELTESSGGLCGATFVDESFMKFALTRIPHLEEYMKQHPSFQTRLLYEWEEIKCSFDISSGVFPVEIQLPIKLGDTLELTQQDLKAIFDPVVEDILKLIEKQLQQVPDIKVMFVVGGFAGSLYLMQRIRTRFKGQVGHIVSPANPGAAIMQGAVLLALHPDAIVSRIAKKTYGISVVGSFEAGIDPPHLRRIINGKEYCKIRFEVFVRKGERVEINKRVTKSNYTISEDDQDVVAIRLWSSTEQDPRYTEGPNVTKEGEFLISLPANCGKPRPFDVSMFFGRTSIEVKAFMGDGKGRLAGRMEYPVTFYG